MSRPRTYYPTVNRAFYHLCDTFDAFLEKCFEKTEMTDPEKSALSDFHTLSKSARTIIHRYHEKR